MSRSFFSELKRRNVIRAAILYVGAVWALAQGISQLGPSVGAPEWITRWFLVAAAIAFPFWLAFAWFFEFTPEGLKRESEIDPAQSITAHTGKRLDRWIFAVMGLAIVLLLTNTFVWHKGSGLAADADNTPAAENSIAVLPFDNRSSDKEQEYFSDGIADDLLNLLTKIPELQVTARTSSFSFKGKGVPIQDIARQLHVSHILQGAVQKAGNEVRISAQLIDAKSETQRWSQNWDRKLDDIFKVQDEIAVAVVDQLRIKLLGAAPTAKPIDPKAYPLILQAKALIDQGGSKSGAQAIDVLKQALAIAPNESRAWSQLTRAYMNQLIVGDVPRDKVTPLIRDAANRALAIDPDDANVLSYLGVLESETASDLPVAARYFERALRHEPGNPAALNGAAIFLTNIGRLEEARVLYEYRIANDPANPAGLNNLATVEYLTGRWDACIDGMRTVLGLSPSFATAHEQIGLCLLLGKHDTAAAQKEFEAEPDEAARMVGFALARHALGPEKEAAAALQALIDQHGNDQFVYVAMVCSYRGDADAAFKWLGKAVDMSDPNIAAALTEPLFTPLHGDARWLPFLRRIGYAPEQLAKIEFKVTLPAAEGVSASGGANH